MYTVYVATACPASLLPGQLGSRIQLDGAWSFKAQIDALHACNQEDACRTARASPGGSCQGGDPGSGICARKTSPFVRTL